MKILQLFFVTQYEFYVSINYSLCLQHRLTTRAVSNAPPAAITTSRHSGLLLSGVRTFKIRVFILVLLCNIGDVFYCNIM
jgi:hypothetical protein